MWDGSSRTVATKIAFRKQFDLFMICMTGNRARRAYSTTPALFRTSKAEIDGLSKRAKRVRAVSEIVWQRERRLFDKVLLGCKDFC